MVGDAEGERDLSHKQAPGGAAHEQLGFVDEVKDKAEDVADKAKDMLPGT